MKVGAAFGDFIRTEKPSKRWGFDEFSINRGPQMRSYLMLLFLFLFLGMIFFKLFSLQILQGSYYRNLADGNRIKTTNIYAPRGIIFDRNNVPLVFNVPGFRKVDKEKPTLLKKEEALKYIARGENLEVDSLREYPYKEAMVHVLGYVGQISEVEIKNDFQGYELTDILGKNGIEKEYEAKLKGIDGKQLVEVNALGKTVRTLGQTEAVAGEDITLNLDAKLQQAAFSAMKDVKKGAVIVSTPKGEILALLSKPSFDPNLFTMGDYYSVATDSAYQNIESVLLDRENHPLLDRAISGVYPPGSTFKIVNAATGLEDKIIDENYQVEDTGILKVGAFSFGNWYFSQYGKTEGLVNVVTALKRSNDIFFYKLAEKNGLERLSLMASKFGVGRILGIDLEGEAKGLLPSDSWKKKAVGESWYLGDTYHYGIGQGYLLTTPLQVNSWTQVIASGGRIYQPQLLKNSEVKVKNSKFLSEKTIDLIRQGMIESCSPGGVAWPLFEFKVKNSKLKIDGKNFLEAPQSTVSADFKDYRKVALACKTGTAQHGGETTLPHAWITLFAPAYDPQIVITVLAEESGEGSSIAAPIAKKILEEWFSGK